MGYRSQVAYTVRFTHDDDTNNKQSFYTFLAEIKVNEVTAAIIDALEIDEAAYSINFYRDSTKWYPSFPDVQAHEKVLEIVDQWCNDDGNHSGIWYVFARVGEELEDNEYRENGGTGHVDYNAVNISRSIVVDWL
tara:strand:+ start:572 stop:976 length:405 start_codon:yes stop_codon:yes gene_type:complete